jgi:hypothetical protein
MAEIMKPSVNIIVLSVVYVFVFTDESAVVTVDGP